MTSSSPSGSAPDSPQARARAVLGRWLTRRQAGAEVAIDELCAEHPDLAEVLRSLHAEVLRVEELLAQGDGMGSLAETRIEPLSEKLANRFGSDVDPSISLEAEGEADPAFAGEVLERLSGRAGGSGRYRLKGEVGRGGMGAVLRVWDEDLRRHLAMKVILGKGAPKPTGDTPPANSKHLARFLEEAQVTSQLDHPGIVPVHELGLDTEGQVYFTMKLVKGRTFKEVIELATKGADGWSRTRALEVVLKICDAMAYAHEKHVIHRDLKPANVMVGRFGAVYVMDWGVARILGRKDSRDVRIREEATALTTFEVASDRQDEAVSGHDSPLLTMDGQVVGTPAYMSPEQAEGRLEDLGPKTDVYAVGAILYHVLTGRLPYVKPGQRVNNYAVWRWVCDGPPQPLHEVAQDVPVELASICEKAMAREPKDRYASMEALAEDLRAYLEGRVVGAFETGAWAEARKWVRRNKPLAASLAAAVVLLVVGLGTALVLRRQAVDNAIEAKRQEQIARANLDEAKRQERVAEDNAAEAQLNFEEARRQEQEALRQERIAKRRAEDVLSLSAFQELEDLASEAEQLWPPWPEHLDAYERWLAGAEKLVGGLDPSPDGADLGHRGRLAAQRARALPRDEEQIAEERRAHERYDELLLLQGRLRSLRRAQAVREGKADAPSFELDPDAWPEDATEVTARAWPLVDPDREVFGREAEGLALAYLALDLGGAASARALSTLAWGFFANGLDADAKVAAQDAANAAGSAERATYEQSSERLAMEIADHAEGELLAQLAEQVAALEAEVSEHREWRFEDEQQRWWHNQLTKLVAELEAFADPDTGLVEGTSPDRGWGVRKRRDWASSVVERTMTGEEVAAKWAACLGRIAASEVYAGLELGPQLGLVPLGADRASGLEEFGHPLTGSVPARGEDGALVLTDDFGLVFVLIPAGSCTAGAQNGDVEGPNHDPLARPDEDVHRIQLSAFFLSKYEMTQSQWQRLADRNPSTYLSGEIRVGHRITPRNPVEQVSWQSCEQRTRQMGLSLPSEAQWEYAARAGTSTPWWAGEQAELLGRTDNVADAYMRSSVTYSCEAWSDGHGVHAPVGSYAPNAFGLCDVHGNVREWCFDAYDSGLHSLGSSIDPVNDAADARLRVVRGGSFLDPASRTRSSSRHESVPERVTEGLGLRPARAVSNSLAAPRLPSGR